MKAIKHLFQFLIIFSVTIGFAQNVEEPLVSNRLVGSTLVPGAIIHVEDSKFPFLVSGINDFTSVNSAVNIHIGFIDES
ncbi:hypothetical protein, partial [Flavobacterium sp.]|uniref:hypothetical protein n=1 Tax=Flavobacterium sp. TaxID=239 RepID=UPI00262A696A